MIERKRLEVEHKANDVLTIEGVDYAGDLFREFRMGPTPGRLFKVISRDDGTVTVKTWLVDEAAFEAWHAEQEELRLKRFLETV